VPASGSLKLVAVACSRVWQGKVIPGLRAAQRPETMPIRSPRRVRSGRRTSTFGKAINGERLLVGTYCRIYPRSQFTQLPKGDSVCKAERINNISGKRYIDHGSRLASNALRRSRIVGPVLQ
jgi:hypothetical protein